MKKDRDDQLAFETVRLMSEAFTAAKNGGYTGTAFCIRVLGAVMMSGSKDLAVDYADVVTKWALANRKQLDMESINEAASDFIEQYLESVDDEAIN